MASLSQIESAAAPGSQNHVCLGHGESVGKADVGSQTFISCSDVLVSSFVGTSCEPLPGQSPLSGPALRQVSSTCSWKLPVAQFFTVWVGLVDSNQFGLACAAGCSL